MTTAGRRTRQHDVARFPPIARLALGGDLARVPRAIRSATSSARGTPRPRAVIAWVCLVGFAAMYLVDDVDLPRRSCRASRPACCSLPLVALFAHGHHARARLPGTVERAARVLRCRRRVDAALALPRPRPVRARRLHGRLRSRSSATPGPTWASSPSSPSRSGSRCSRSAGSIATVIELRTARAEVARLAVVRRAAAHLPRCS